MQYKTYLFDFDYTLANSEKGIVMCFEKLLKAKSYLDKLANGINPITNELASENDTINNIHISRCLFYVSDVLRNLIENNNNPQKRKASSTQKK